jgi:hypothetical protein
MPLIVGLVTVLWCFVVFLLFIYLFLMYLCSSFCALLPFLCCLDYCFVVFLWTDLKVETFVISVFFVDRSHSVLGNVSPTVST